MAKHSASAVIVWGDNVLLKPAGKRFKLVGGKAKMGESPTDTVVREAMEETGICLDFAQLESVAEYTKHSFFLCRLDQEPVLAQNRKFYWVSLRELTKKSFLWWSYWKALRIAKAMLAEPRLA